MEKEIKIEPINKQSMVVRVKSIEGSTYISHRLDEDVVAQFTARETGKAEKKKLRDFDKEYESCFHYVGNPIEKKYGIPAACFFKAILNAAVACKIDKIQVKRAMKILGDVYPIEYKKLNRRIDTPRRPGMNAAPDIRHRPEFVDWSANIFLEFDANQISPEQILNLINQAGFSSGIGDWRPNSPRSGGSHGMFEVDRQQIKIMGRK